MTENFSLKELNKHDFPMSEEIENNLNELAKRLQVVRDNLGKPIIILSGLRSKEYNDKVGGKTKSKHLTGEAADIKVMGMSSNQLKAFVESLIQMEIVFFGGIGLYKTFVHVDIRKKKTRWNG